MGKCLTEGSEVGQDKFSSLAQYCYLMSLLHHACMLELVLEEEQVVCGCYCNDILCRVPCCVQNLFIEVKAVNADLVLLTFSSCTNLCKI
jgi:hypothetical protein